MSTHKVTLLSFWRYALVAGIVFLFSRTYYQSVDTGKNKIEIIPSDIVITNEPITQMDSINQVIKMADESMVDKFVPSDKNHSKVSKNSGSTVQKDQVSDLKIYEGTSNWARAGQPYVVPQMTEQDKKLKVKRYLAPK
ncbi:UNVERIFIED_ORG: hypothetical protein M2414_004172 [Rahnella aquatilis]